MIGLVKIAATVAAGFWRAGRHWPHEGVVVNPAELAEGVLERLKAEPMLRVTPVNAAHPPQSLDDAQLAEALKAVIATLEQEDFGKDGKPKIPALKERLPDEKDRITVELRDAVWDAVKPSN